MSERCSLRDGHSLTACEPYRSTSHLLPRDIARRTLGMAVRQAFKELKNDGITQAGRLGPELCAGAKRTSLPKSPKAIFRPRSSIVLKGHLGNPESAFRSEACGRRSDHDHSLESRTARPPRHRRTHSTPTVPLQNASARLREDASIRRNTLDARVQNHSVLTDVLGTAHESPQLCQVDVSEYPRLPGCDATLDRHPSSLPMATLSYMSTLHSTGRRIASASSMSLGSRVGSAQSSLLSDTPSFAAFKMLRLDGDELDEAQSHMVDDSPLRNKGRKNRTLHREVTMHNLVHKLDSSRSRSLTALIHALDNASPGLYQSLVNCATMPACISDCSLISIDEESQEHIYSLGSAGPSGVERQAGVPAHALPSDILDELDILAAKIRKLPLPQGPTLLPPDADDAFPTTAIHTRAIESSPINNHEQCAYTSRKTAYVSPQTHLSTPESVAGPIVSWSIPKLTRTFGRRSRNTVTPRKRSSDAANDAHSLARSSDIARRISHSPPPSTPLVTVKSPGATPKSSRIKSFFRRGPRCSAPPALENIGKKASQIPRTTRCNQQEALAGVPRSPYRGDLGLHNGPFSHL